MNALGGGVFLPSHNKIHDTHTTGLRDFTKKRKMPTIVSVVKEVAGAFSLKERSAVVLGTKSSLSAANVFQYCKCVSAYSILEIAHCS